MTYFPVAIEWGNAADWASAIGSFCAVVAALWIAFGQGRNARKLRQIAKNDEHERNAHLIGEVIRLTAEIESIVTGGAKLVDLGGGQSGNLLSRRDDIEGARSQLRALQQFPHSDPRIFGEIGRIIRASELPSDFATATSSYQANIFRGLAKELASRREILTTMLEP